MLSLPLSLVEKLDAVLHLLLGHLHGLGGLGVAGHGECENGKRRREIKRKKESCLETRVASVDGRKKKVEKFFGLTFFPPVLFKLQTERSLLSLARLPYLLLPPPRAWQMTAPEAATAPPAEQQQKPKKKICCACPETKVCFF